MKISREEKEKVRARILDVAAELMSEKGFYATTMKDISRAAKISDPTVYRYFATKEKLLFDFFAVKMEEAIESLSAIPEFENFSFAEQLHAFTEAQIRALVPGKNVIGELSPSLVLLSLSSHYRDYSKVRDRFIEVVDEMLEAAIEVGEFPKPAFRSLVLETLWEGNVGLLHYWAHDHSKNHGITTQMIDAATALASEVLKAAVLTKVGDVAKLFIRHHFMGFLERTRHDLKGVFNSHRNPTEEVDTEKPRSKKSFRKSKGTKSRH